MNRAPRMAPDERRRALIEATRPLLLEHGDAVSTRQIAAAAGVAEGTIFRVFDSKEDLVHATVLDTLTENDLPQQLAALPPDADLTTTVTAVVAKLTAHITRIRTLVVLLHSQGQHLATPRPPAHDKDHDTAPDASPRCERPDPTAVHARVRDAVAATLTPHADALRVTPQHAASALVALTFGSTHTFSGDAGLADPATLADLLLHGTRKDA
ncbi:MAG: helix-turn-helix domain-containing protein [Propionibacteriaceae bacterium]|nr:helix-turn-helix domain-containing protein [Propionibacteriaceae bacterium]